MQENIFFNIPELLERVNVINQERDIKTKDEVKDIQIRLKEIQVMNCNLIKAIETGQYSKVIHDKIVENEAIEKELIKDLDELLRKQKASTITAEFLSSMLEEAKEKIYVQKDEIETNNLVQKFVN